MKVTINQLRQIIKEEISRSALMKEYFFFDNPSEEEEPEDQFREGDAAWENFMNGLDDIRGDEPSYGMLGKLLYNYFNPLVAAFRNNEELKAIGSELSDTLDDNPSPEKQMEIVNGIEDRVRKALGFEGKGYY
jgi:hypothetical protein